MKKALAFTLVAAMLLTFMAVPTFAADDAPHTDFEFAKAFDFVTDAETAADTVITRIQLAEIFYNIVFRGQNISSTYWGEGDFPDVPTEKKHIASAVYSMGVMRGYSDSVFAPNDYVTYTQAVKAMVTFLGYSFQAEKLGGYPSGYLAQATVLRILPGGNVSGDALATYGAIATMLKKAVGVDFATLDGNGHQEILEGTDFLKFYRDICVTKGVITGNYLTDIYGNEKTNYFGIYVNGYSMEVAESADELQLMLGREVFIYYTAQTDGYMTAIYYEEGNNNVLEISSDDISNVAKGSVTYYTNEVGDVTTVAFPSNIPLIYNGTYEASYTADVLNPFKTGVYDGSIKLVDNGGNGTYDVIVVTAFQTIVVNDVRNNKIYGKYEVSDNIYDKVIDVTYYKERNINIRNIVGEKTELDLIKKGHVLNFCCDTKGEVKEIIVSKDSMTGVIEEIIYSGTNPTQITISGITFECAASVMVYNSANKSLAGLTADVYFNCEAEVAIIDVENRYTDGYRVGYLVDAGIEGTLDKKVLCMVFDSEGTMQTYTLSDNVSLNGTAKLDTDVLAAFGTGEDGRVARKLLLYKTDDYGTVITAIVTAAKLASDSDAFDGFYQFPGSTYYYKGAFKSFSDKYLANDNTITFGVPDLEDRDKYEDYVVTELPQGEGNNIGKADSLVNMEIYGSSEKALVVDYAVINTHSGAASGVDRRPTFVVTKVSESIDDEGELGLRIAGIFVEGTSIAEGSFFIDKNLILQGHDKSLPETYVSTGQKMFINQSETLPAPGDVYRFSSFATTGRIDLMNCQETFQLYDYGDDKFIDEINGYYQDHGMEQYHVMGTVEYKDDTAIKVRLRTPAGTTETRAFELSAGYYKYIEITKNALTGDPMFEISTSNAILSEETHPGEASEVLIQYRSGGGMVCVIFNY